MNDGDSSNSEFTEEEDVLNSLIASISDTRLRIRALKYELEWINSQEQQDYEEINQIAENERLKIINSDSLKEFKTQYAEMARLLFQTFEQKSTQKAVEVVFNSQKFKFKLSETITFDELKCLVGRNLGVSKDKIFFSMDSNEQYPAVLIGKETVIKEVYAWKTFKIRKTNPEIHVILSDYQTVEEMQGELVPEEKTRKLSSSSESELKPEPVIKEKKKTAAEKVTARVYKNTIINFIEALMLFGFFSMWVLSVIDELNISEVSWMNFNIQNRLYEYPFKSSNTKIYPKLGSDFFLIKHKTDFWDYYSVARNRFFTETYPTRLNSFTYLYEALEFRQVRSNMHFCEIEEYGDTPCTKRYSLDKNTDDFSAKSEGFLYDSEGEAEFLLGKIDIYGFDGFKTSMPLQDDNTWEITILTLISQNWIDSQTRAVFVAYNMVNPSIGQLSTIIDIIEIGPYGEFVLSYKISTIKYTNINIDYIIFHAGIFMWVFCLLFLQLRKNLMGLNEKNFMNNLNTSVSLRNSLSEVQFEKRMKKKLKEWKEHEKTACFKRLRKPESDEVMVLVVVMTLFALEFADSFYYFHEMSTLTAEEGTYTNLYVTVRDQKMLIDLKLVALVFLAIVLCRSFTQWVKTLSEIYDSSMTYFKDLALVILLSYTIFAFFSVIAFYMTGPYMQSTSSVEHAFFWTVSLIAGTALVDESVSSFVPIWCVFLLCVLYRVIFFMIMMISASHFFLKLEINRLSGSYSRTNQENK